MLNVWYNDPLGVLTIAQPKWKASEDGHGYAKDADGKLIQDGWKRFRIDICRCNALAAFISKWKDDKGIHRELWYFFADRSHAERIWKADGSFWGRDKVVKIQLNMAHPNAHTLMTIFTRCGYKVECYYKAPKKAKGKTTKKTGKHGK